MIGKAIGAGAIGAAGVGAGYLAGTAWGANTPGANYEASGTMGALAGGAIGLTAGAIAMNPLKAASAVGGLAIGTAEVAGAGIIAGAEGVGAGIIGAAKIAMPVAGYAAGKYASIGAGVAKHIDKYWLKEDKRPSNILGTKMNMLGKTAVVGSALIGGTAEAFDQFNTNRMGQRDGMITRATPRTPSYANNAGATGDLVFAMNRNRRG